jgi:ribose transport system substrate-binding protein
MVEQLQPLAGWIEAGGGEFTILSCEYDIARQMSMYDDTITRKPDAIISKPINAPSLIPYYQQANAAGIKVLNSLLPVLGPDKKPIPETTTYVGDYNDDRGLVTGQYLNYWAEKNKTHVNVLEIWGIYGFEEWSVPVDKGFVQGIGDSKWITKYDSGEGQFNDDLGYKVTLDGLTAHPDINAIYCTTCMSLHGVISALKSVDRWAPIGDPKHMMLLTGDAEPWMIDYGLQKYIDFDMDYG